MADSNENNSSPGGEWSRIQAMAPSKPRPHITPLLLPKPYFKDSGTVLKSVQAPESPRTSKL